MKRPWQDAVPPLLESVEQVVEFPTDDEDVGVVSIAWRCQDWVHQQTHAAIDILWECVREFILQLNSMLLTYAWGLPL